MSPKPPPTDAAQRAGRGRRARRHRQHRLGRRLRRPDRPGRLLGLQGRRGRHDLADGARFCALRHPRDDHRARASSRRRWSTACRQEVQESLGAQVPFPSRLGQPEEFAGPWPSSSATRYLNGETIRLDGALRMTAEVTYSNHSRKHTMKATEVKKGNVIEHNNTVYQVRDIERSSPQGRGGNLTIRFTRTPFLVAASLILAYAPTKT